MTEHNNLTPLTLTNEGLKKTKGFFSDFKTFAVKGNAVDMAVGIIIGGAFGGIVNSLVNDMLMPFVGMITAGQDFSKMAFHFGDGSTINYGLFIQAVVNFILIALTIFIVVKVLNSISRKKDAEVAPAQVDVLIEIRDLLKGRDEEASHIAEAIEAIEGE